MLVTITADPAVNARSAEIVNSTFPPVFGRMIADATTDDAPRISPPLYIRLSPSLVYLYGGFATHSSSDKRPINVR